MLAFEGSEYSICKGPSTTRLPSCKMKNPNWLPKWSILHFHQPQCCWFSELTCQIQYFTQFKKAGLFINYYVLCCVENITKGSHEHDWAQSQRLWFPWSPGSWHKTQHIQACWNLNTLKISLIICILIIHYAFIYFKLFNHVFENFYQYSVLINSLESHQESNPLAKIWVWCTMALCEWKGKLLLPKKFLRLSRLPVRRWQ